jgi:hypothetical protein
MRIPKGYGFVNLNEPDLRAIQRRNLERSSTAEDAATIDAILSYFIINCVNRQNSITASKVQDHGSHVGRFVHTPPIPPNIIQ